MGNPLRFLLTGGQAADVTQAEALLEGFAAEYVIADKGYDSDPLRTFIRQEVGAEPVIPPRSNRRAPAEYDTHLYQERHLIECFINKIKHYRRIFTRFDKLAARFMAFLQFVATLIWLR